jgi:hypothetical protein
MILWDDFIPENIEANTPLFAAASELFLAAGDRAAVIRGRSIKTRRSSAAC